VCRRTGNSIFDFAIALKQDAAPSELIHASNIGSATNIELAVPAGSDVSQLWVAIASSEGSHFQITGPASQSLPGDGGPIDFTEPLTYTVTAEDGGTRTYSVRVSSAGSNELAALSINGYWGAIRGDLITVSIPENPEGYDLSNVTPVFVKDADASVTPGGPVSFTNGESKDFTLSVTGSPSTIYHVTVNVGTDLSSAKDFLSFMLPGQVSSVIDTLASTVTVVMPMAADLSSVTPTFAVSNHATVWPSASAVTSFEVGVAETLFVIAQDATVKPYQVTVNLDSAN
jgi:hypothetical protein